MFCFYGDRDFSNGITVTLECCLREISDGSVLGRKEPIKLINAKIVILYYKKIGFWVPLVLEILEWKNGDGIDTIILKAQFLPSV